MKKLIAVSLFMIGNGIIATVWSIPWFLTPVGVAWYLTPVHSS